jgi:hypothetical protein
LRYKSKAVDLACLNQACKVKVTRKDGASRARGEDTHRSAFSWHLIAAPSTPATTASRGGKE